MINKVGILITVILILSACELTDKRKNDIDSSIINVPASASGTNEEAVPVLVFENSNYDFGQISQGEKVTYTYRFTNTGKSDLIIAKVEGSCGCTVMKGWPKHPIKPGGKGKIDVIFDSAGRRGKQNKSISVVANTLPSTTVLKLEGEIVAPDNN